MAPSRPLGKNTPTPSTLPSVRMLISCVHAHNTERSAQASGAGFMVNSWEPFGDEHAMLFDLLSVRVLMNERVHMHLRAAQELKLKTAQVTAK